MNTCEVLDIVMRQKRALHSTPHSSKSEIKKAISEWVSSLTSEEAKTKSVFLCGMAYTPLEIQNEVERETAFGAQFLSELSALNEQMIHENPNSSIVELIRGV